MNRRTFLGSTALSTGAAKVAAAAADVQTRALGKTGLRVPIVAMGCGASWWEALNDEKKCFDAVNLAVDLGIRYLDTGQTYGKGTSERWLGNAIHTRRKDVFIATKISTRDSDEALRETERSLERLQTTWIDVLHIHNLGGEEDLARIEKKGGLLDTLRKLREQKVARFIGVTSHNQPVTLKAALERHDFDCVQMALNAAKQGHYETAAHPGNSFESIALPVAQAKGMGIIAMKVTGRATLVGGTAEKAQANELIRYALSLPISLAVVGLADHGHIRENAELARTFRPMSETQMRSFAERMTRSHKANLDRYFSDHVDG